MKHGTSMTIKLTSSKLDAYKRLMRLDRPIGIYLLLWPTLWALLIASSGLPTFGVTLIFVTGVVVMRSAGCVINDYADRNVDGEVKRTSQRPIVKGEITPDEALTLFCGLIGIAFLLVLFLNWQTILLSVVALGLAASYPFMKRYTHLPQVVLGAAYGWCIPMAFMAVTQTVPVWGWWLFFANLCWTVAYDTMYAMVDRDDDLKVGIKSTAILFGHYDVVIILGLQGVSFALLIAVGQAISATFPYYFSLALAAGLVYRQYQFLKFKQREGCFTAFLESHFVGMAITFGLLGHYFVTWLFR